MGIRVFIIGYEMNVKSQFLEKQGILATRSRDWNESRVNYQARLYFLSYSALAVVTFQLPACFTRVALWQLASCESVARSSRETPLESTELEFLHTLLHTILTLFPPNYWVSTC